MDPILHISLDEIREDVFFRFTSDSDIQPLVDSIRVSGICAPLIVRKMGEDYQLVSGFRRLASAIRLGLATVPAFVTSEDQPIHITFQHALLAHLTCHLLNLMEKARILGILQRLEIPSRLIETDFLPLLDLPPQGALLNEVRSLLTLDASVQTYIETVSMSLKQASVMLAFSHEDQRQLMDLAAVLQIRSVELLQITGLLDDLVRRDQVSLAVLFDRLAIHTLLEDQDLSRNAKLTRLKLRLAEAARPVLTQQNTDLEALRGKLARLPNVKMSWDPTLEKPGVVLSAQITSDAEWKAVKRFVSNPAHQEIVRHMLERV